MNSNAKTGSVQPNCEVCRPLLPGVPAPDGNAPEAETADSVASCGQLGSFQKHGVDLLT